ncbi:MAG: ABC transporter permease [Gemmatimonadota bacterium]
MVRALCRTVLRFLPGRLRDPGLEELPDVIAMLVRDARDEDGLSGAVVVGAREVGTLVLLVATAWGERCVAGVRGFTERQRRRLAPDMRIAVLLARRDAVRSCAAVLLVGVVGATVAVVVPEVEALRAPSNADVPEADRLAWIWGDRPWEPAASPLVSDVHLAHVRNRAESFEESAAIWMVSGRVTGARGPVHADVARVSANFFDVIGARAGHGRLFEPGEDRRGAAWVAVLTHDFWMQHFNGDPGVIGRTIVVGVPEMMVVGVLDEHFEFSIPEALGPYGTPGVWLPARHNFEGGTLPNDVQAILGLRREDTSEADAIQELAGLSSEIDAAVYNDRGFRYRIDGLAHGGSPELALAGRAIHGVVGLLIAVSTGLLMLIGVTASRVRRQTFHLVGVIGGGGGRPALLHALQGLLLGAAGLATSLVVALPAMGWLGVGWGTRPPLYLALGMGAIALLSVSYASAATLSDVAARRRAGSPLGTQRGARFLVAVQVSGALVVLAGAALLDTRVREVTEFGGGLAPSERVSFALYPMPDDYPDGPSRELFFERVSEALMADEAIHAVTAVSALPLSGGSTQVPASRSRPAAAVDPESFSVAEWTGFDGALMAGDSARTRWIDLNVARPGFFGDDVVALSRGRGFESGDSLGGRRTVVISGDLEDALWEASSAIGDSVWLVGGWREVVGVVEPIALHGMVRRGEQAWVPHAQVLAGRMSVVVTTSLSPGEVDDRAAEVVGAIDPEVPIGATDRWASVLTAEAAEARRVSNLAVILSIVAVLLAVAAVQALVAGIVTARRDEVVLRMLLGGGRRAVLWLVLREGLVPIMMGLAVGGLAYGMGEGVADPLALVGGGAPPTLVWVWVVGAAFTVSVLAALVPVMTLYRAHPRELLNGR